MRKTYVYATEFAVGKELSYCWMRNDFRVWADTAKECAEGYLKIGGETDFVFDPPKYGRALTAEERADFIRTLAQPLLHKKETFKPTRDRLLAEPTL